MVKRKLLCVIVFLTAFVFAGSAMAATSVSWLTPPENSSYAVGTAVTVTGNAAGQGGSGGTGLDLVLVMDSSGSMGWYGGQAAQSAAAKALVAALPQATTSVGIVNFDDDIDEVLALTQLNGTNTAVNDVIDRVDAYGGTDIAGGIDAATPLLTASTNTDRLQAMVVMSDGDSTLSSARTAANNAAAAGVEAIHSIGMGSTVSVSTLQAVVDGPDNNYSLKDDNYGIFTAAGIDELLGIFSGTAGNFVGLDHIDITDPDAVLHSAWSLDDGAGNFHIDWTLALGANVFQVDAYGDDGSSATAFITLYGTDNGNQVPEPATMALFGLGLIGLAGISRKKE